VTEGTPLTYHEPMKGARRSVWILLAAFLMGCADSSEIEGVVLVVVDTLRADHLGSYGYARPISPRLDELAADATRFAAASSSAPWTLPAMGTVMTSLYPTVHGAVARSDTGEWRRRREEFRPVSVLAESHLTLAEVLSGAGFETAAFVRGSYPTRIFGFAQGFDHFGDNDAPGIRFQVENLLEWLDERSPERFFVYLHVIEVHTPYQFGALAPKFHVRLPEDRLSRLLDSYREERARFRAFDSDPDYDGPLDGSLASVRALQDNPTAVRARERDRLISLYDQGVRYTDHWLGELLDGLRERKRFARTLLVVTSDHGEELFDHGSTGHGHSYYEELVRVPLIIRHPEAGHGEIVEEPVGLVDIMPTVLDLVGIEADPALQGTSLASVWRGEDLPKRSFFAEARGDPTSGALRVGNWKYVWGGGKRLFDLWSDPGEQKNLCREELERCRALSVQAYDLKQAFEDHAARPSQEQSQPAALDDDTRERLRALGYTAAPGEGGETSEAEVPEEDTQ
jgi:arylsulfatase A-like enzyme